MTSLASNLRAWAKGMEARLAAGADRCVVSANVLRTLARDLGEYAEAAERLAAGRDEARHERDAVTSLLVQPWPAGGWCARLPYRPEGYAGGTWQVSGSMTWYWFREQDETVAAVRLAAELPEANPCA